MQQYSIALRVRDLCLNWITHGLVPIGYPIHGMDAIIVDDEMQEVAAGDDGELLISGPQVAIGYWNDVDERMQHFWCHLENRQDIIGPVIS